MRAVLDLGVAGRELRANGVPARVGRVHHVLPEAGCDTAATSPS